MFSFVADILHKSEHGGTCEATYNTTGPPARNLTDQDTLAEARIANSVVLPMYISLDRRRAMTILHFNIVRALIV